ncbi:MAG TPA: hypothetical protein VHW71_01525 [Steroidobacteraceae bacterium]|nr:hypothetical protein [Steroidobacteraceae bacterium]
MSRPLRLDFHGAIHLVRMRGREGYNIYFDQHVLNHAAVERWQQVPHLLQFLKHLDECCSECGTDLFGYCVQPNEATLLLRTAGAPLDACMQRLGGRYARYLHAREVLPKSVGPYAARYESKVLAPEYLPHALRRVHARPLHSGLARRALDYPFSSAPAYVGARSSVHLQTAAVWFALERKGMSGSRGYLEFMEKPETTHVSLLFDHGSPLDARVVGGHVFVTQVRDAMRHPRAPPTRDQLIQAVERLLTLEPAQVFGAGHQGVLARALVAWYAMRSGMASVREAGTWFGVSGATLGKAIRHHRSVSPELFSRKSLPGIPPADAGASEDNN